MASIPILSPYLHWLQKGNPVGAVERYPQLDAQSQSTVPGVYVVGDLTGIPLLKMAAESGARVVRTLLADADFQARRVRNRATDADGVRDVLILGAGPAGIACALACEQQGLDYEVLESAQLFGTLENFPKGKPILAKPDGYAAPAPLEIRNGTKESLLADLHRQLAGRNLRVTLGARVEAIRKRADVLHVETRDRTLKALRVILAIGKSGDARRLGIPGESQAHVFNRLFDPGEFHGKEIAVVGGGDTAVEAAIALAEGGNHVRLIHRKATLDRPKPENAEKLAALCARGAAEMMMGAQVQSIGTDSIAVKSDGTGPSAGSKTAPGSLATLRADAVFVLIGRELPLAFFKRSGIRLAGEKDKSSYVFLTAMLGFFAMLYFGKAGVARDVFKGASGSGLQGLIAHVAAYFTGPWRQPMDWSLHHYSWYGALAFHLGWIGSLVFLLFGPAALSIMLRRRRAYFGTPWKRIKHGYLIAVAVAFTAVYFRSLLSRDAGWAEEPTYFYSLFYTLTIGLFGARRMYTRRTRYVRLQVMSLFLVQAFFLFILPFHLFDPLLKAHLDPNGYVMREMFPAGKWSCFGFILFWPLDVNDFGTSAFWTWFPFVQTFGILFLLVRTWGKGAYCGWICSCGGMAETLGDEYREAAPHGAKPKRLENIGQFVLAAALLMTAAGYAAHHTGLAGGRGELLADTFRGLYKLAIDVIFAGVVGFGAYFLYAGRIWCRFGCPLAATMHIFGRFSRYRILSDKKNCISCNICTKVCHMGIDVMAFANKGKPMDDVQCVRCSACVQGCPTQVLSFGSIPSAAGPKT